ncbi:DUF6272 family protein [Allocoleopsis sp.]|uniref:DUF6272 family protein n=1 Tax=Allocoleopsis sp. TaxID=3088169 RepID=UPI002FD70AED
MSRIFGNFIENFPSDHDSLELNFTLSSRFLKKQWPNNRLSAFFIADYCSNFLLTAEDDVQEQERINEMKSAISYVGNELLENALKFNEGIKPPYNVKFGIHFLENSEKAIVVIFTQNTIATQNLDKFQTLIKELLSADDLNQLYERQIEKISEDENNESSGLGLLTVINDYSAKLGWKFEPDSSNSQIIAVTTMAQVVV